MKTATASGQSLGSRTYDSGLDHRYKQIGISALVAALPYRSQTQEAVAKTSAKRPVESRD